MPSTMVFDRAQFASAGAAPAPAPTATPGFCAIPTCDIQFEKCKGGFKIHCKCDDEIACDLRRRVPEDVSLHVRGRPTGTPAPATPGTLEHFLAERYALFTNLGGRHLWRARVHHPAYPLQTATVGPVRQTLAEAAGVPVSGQPALAHAARRVDVGVWWPERLR